MRPRLFFLQVASPAALMLATSPGWAQETAASTDSAAQPSPEAAAASEAGTSEAGPAATAPEHTAEAKPVEITVQGSTHVNAASQTTTGHRELMLRPRAQSSDLMESVPGLFATSHAGGGDASEWTLRGFDAGHGTDLAVFVDGVPVNAPSHIHGQGYADLHFVIPELAISVDGYKGPYAARFGNFATAGAVELRLAESLPESYAQYSLGQYGMMRGLAIASPKLHDRWRTTLAAEVAKEDGPFKSGEDLRRYNVFARASYDIDDASKVTMTLMSYGSDWHAAGLLPARAVCGEGERGILLPAAYGQPCLDRFATVDDSQGGKAQRHMASVAYSMRDDESELTSLSYVIRSGFSMFENPTYYMDDPVNGDQIEQKDDRTVVGSNLDWHRHDEVGALRLTHTVGLQFRADAIDGALYHDYRRYRLGPALLDDEVNERSLAIYGQEELQPLRQLRFVLGARGDHVDVGDRSGARFSPKFAAVVSPIDQLDVFGNYGWGFHTNDARGAQQPINRATLIVPVVSYEAGLRIKPHRNFQLSSSAFLMNIDSELTWDAESATTQSTTASRRYGVEVEARYHLENWFFADAAATFTKARYTDHSGAVPNAPTQTVSAGAEFMRPFGKYTPFAGLRLRLLGQRPANPQETLFSRGSAVLNADAGLRWWNLEARLDVTNVLDADWRDVSEAYSSQLAYETAPVEGVHYSAGWPRTIMGSLRFYWQ
jgi:outer membrane receptor protein involved in Fe transport